MRFTEADDFKSGKGEMGMNPLNPTVASNGKRSKIDIIEAVAQHGFFLQRHCAEVVGHLGWRVEEEYPVSLTYSVGSTPKVYEGTGDILGRMTINRGHWELVMHMQVKRRSGKNWFFFRDLSGKMRIQLPRLECFEEGPHIEPHIEVRPESLNLKGWPQPPPPVCTIGRETLGVAKNAEEVKDEFTTNELYRTCQEAAFSVRSILSEDREDNEELLRDNLQSFAEFPPRSLHLPVVVTAATIHTIDFKALRYRETENEGASSTVVPYLVYKFPLARSLQVELDTDFPLELDRLKHLYTFIVNYGSLEQFARSLSKFLEETLYPN